MAHLHEAMRTVNIITSDLTCDVIANIEVNEMGSQDSPLLGYRALLEF